jgi:hypothetical protein
MLGQPDNASNTEREEVSSIVQEAAATLVAALARAETHVIKFVVAVGAVVIATMGICTGILVAFLG